MIGTFTGRRVSPTDLKPTDIDIVDIAHSLSMQCRFNGHVHNFYSVAEHSCHVADMLPQHLKLTGLLHDACEAYFGDMVSPLKINYPGFMCDESQAIYKILHRFGINCDDLPDEVHAADRMMARIEGTCLMANWEPKEPGWQYLPCWSPPEAKREFLKRFNELA